MLNKLKKIPVWPKYYKDCKFYIYKKTFNIQSERTEIEINIDNIFGFVFHNEQKRELCSCLPCVLLYHTTRTHNRRIAKPLV